MVGLRISSLLTLVVAVYLASSSVGAQADSYEVTLQSEEGWEILTFSGTKANQVSFSEQGMLIAVDQSASPLIFPLPVAKTISEVSLQLEINGYLNLDGNNQGEKDADDFIFRLGLVHAGDRQLNFLQRSVAPAWIRRLYELAPDNTGISHIEFYNVYSDRQLAGKSRIHPRSDLMLENFISQRPADSNQLAMTFKPESAKPVLAIWLSIDGDDTGSSYQILLKELILSAN